MSELRERRLESERVFDGRLLHVRRDRVTISDGSESVREWIDHPGAAAVLPLHDDGSVSLVRQYRYAAQREFLEVPAGKIDRPGEDPRDLALRELEEETGLAAGKIDRLASLYPAVGYANEVIHLYLATQLEQRDQRLDPGELLLVERLPFEEVVAMALAGELRDMKTVSTVLLAHAWLGRE